MINRVARHWVAWAVVLGCPCCLSATADAPPANYSNDFEKADEGSMPEQLLVVNGKFQVKKEGGNKFLELAGEPLDAFAFMLGSDEHTTISASIRASSTGKRFPEFGIALSGAGGYKLWLMPAINELQIMKGDDVKVAKPYMWKSGSWLNLKLHRRSEGQKNILEGKVWDKSSPEPADWMISFEDGDKAPKGRPSVWGVPYSGTAIDFDDIAITLKDTPAASPTR